MWRVGSARYVVVGSLRTCDNMGNENMKMLVSEGGFITIVKVNKCGCTPQPHAAV